MTYSLPLDWIEEKTAEALAEDLGDAGDITSLATIAPDSHSEARFVARQDGVLAGLSFARATFLQLNEAVIFTPRKQDGDHLQKGDVIAQISGPTRALLGGERVALNFLGHLSGIASATRQFVALTEGTKAKISCTRKTLPGLRAAQKYAVRCGGAQNHRFGLYDAVMIKDNHIAAAGDITRALQVAKDYVGHMVKIEVEVDSLQQLETVLKAGTTSPEGFLPFADVVLLDNFSLDDLRTAVAQNKGRLVLEASGNVTLKSVRAIAETGVDIISSGWLTHSAPNLDIGLDF